MNESCLYAHATETMFICSSDMCFSPQMTKWQLAQSRATCYCMQWSLAPSLAAAMCSYSGPTRTSPRRLWCRWRCCRSIRLWSVCLVSVWLSTVAAVLLTSCRVLHPDWCGNVDYAWSIYIFLVQLSHLIAITRPYEMPVLCQMKTAVRHSLLFLSYSCITCVQLLVVYWRHAQCGMLNVVMLIDGSVWFFDTCILRQITWWQHMIWAHATSICSQLYPEQK